MKNLDTQTTEMDVHDVKALLSMMGDSIVGYKPAVIDWVNRTITVYGRTSEMTLKSTGRKIQQTIIDYRVGYHECKT